MKDFRKLEIWRNGVAVVKKTYAITANFPDFEKYGLTSQMNRAAVSIPSNIAEGCSRTTNKEFTRFIDIALGSSFELETQYLIARELNWIENSQYLEILENHNALQKSINAYRNFLSREKLQ